MFYVLEKIRISVICLIFTVYRSGNIGDSEAARDELSGQIDNLSRNINIAVENYPDLAAHREIADAMQQNTLNQNLNPNFKVRLP